MNNKPRINELIGKILEFLGKEYVTFGKAHVRGLYAWLFIGIMAGAVAGIAFTANRSAGVVFMADRSVEAEFRRARVVSTGWSTWFVFPNWIFGGQYIAGDPSVELAPDGFHMAYTDHEIVGRTSISPVIDRAWSPDGVNWTRIESILHGRPSYWDRWVETADLIRLSNGTWRLYYSGYIPIPILGPADIGLAITNNPQPKNFVRYGRILQRENNWLDKDALYSPAVFKSGNTWYMIYTGWVISGPKAGIRLLGATSTNGLTWEKYKVAPVLEGPPLGLAWTRTGVAEAHILVGTDGWFYLFFTGIVDEGATQERNIGIARSRNPFGPWDVNQNPIVPDTGSGWNHFVLAPTVELLEDHVKMWFLGLTPNEDAKVGYATSSWPLWTGRISPSP